MPTRSTHGNQAVRALFAERLGYLLRIRAGIDVTVDGGIARAARFLDVSPGTMRKWLAAEALPDPARWDPICIALTCALSDLFCNDEVRHIPRVGVVEIKVIEGIRDGRLRTSMAYFPASASPAFGPGLLLHTVTDNVMEPYVMAKDMVVVDPKITDPTSCSVMLFAINGNLWVRRVQLRIDGQIALIPEASRYQTELLRSPQTTGAFDPESRLKKATIIGGVVGRVLHNR